MLVSFSLKNYKSIYDKVSLDFRIKKEEDIKNQEDNPFIYKINNDYVSKICLFYGHNASGKSNILEALEALLYCNSSMKMGLNKLYNPHGIYGKDKPSEFTIEFYSKSNKNTYHLYYYTIILEKSKNIDDRDSNDIQIRYECLKEDDRTIFERKYNDININTISDEKIAMYSIPTLKFLQEMYNQQKNKEDVYEKIVSYYKIINKLLPSINAPLSSLSSPEFASSIFTKILSDAKKKNIYDSYIQMIKVADVAIDDISLRKTNTVLKKTIKLKDIKTKTKTEILKVLSDFLETTSEYKLDDIVMSERMGWKSPFNKVESEGTKIYSFHLFFILLAVEEGKLSLHDEFYGVQSDLIKVLMILFEKKRFEKKSDTAQLFLTTHDSELMSFKHLTLEQIKFVVKKNHKTYTYSAGDIEGITNDNLIDSYKQNKIGGKYFPRAYALPSSIIDNNKVVK